MLVHGVVFSGKAPFKTGWFSRTTGQGGVVVSGLIRHLVLKLNRTVGVELERVDFKERWIDEVTTKEDISSTSLPLEAIKAIGRSSYFAIWQLPTIEPKLAVFCCYFC